MESKRLHIIAFDVPYPPNYGGIADVYYKLKSLHEQGVHIVYHCFYYKGHNPPTKELEKYCSELHYYKRTKSVLALLFSKTPYVIASRQNALLLNRVIADNDPVLIDGMQCAAWLRSPSFRMKKIIFRANNIEHEYYEGLANWERNPLKKLYLKREARKLRAFEHELKGVDAILSVAKMDIPHFEKYADTVHLPPFFNDSEQSNFSASKENEERFVLFQGNLSVKENEHAAVHIIENIAPLSAHQIKIAGKNPSKYLIRLAKEQSNVQLFDTPSHKEMEGLIRDAHVNLLMTFQQTGIKLKLLHALQSGKHILINSKMDDSGIFAEMCDVIDDSRTIAKKIDALMLIDYTVEMKGLRDAKFNAIYSNEKNAKKIVDLI